MPPGTRLRLFVVGAQRGSGFALLEALHADVSRGPDIRLPADHATARRALWKERSSAACAAAFGKPGRERTSGVDPTSNTAFLPVSGERPRRTNWLRGHNGSRIVELFRPWVVPYYMNFSWAIGASYSSSWFRASSRHQWILYRRASDGCVNSTRTPLGALPADRFVIFNAATLRDHIPPSSRDSDCSLLGVYLFLCRDPRSPSRCLILAALIRLPFRRSRRGARDTASASTRHVQATPAFQKYDASRGCFCAGDGRVRRPLWRKRVWNVVERALRLNEAHADPRLPRNCRILHRPHE